MSTTRAIHLLSDTEALEFLRQKAYQMGFDYQDVWRGVTGAMTLDLEMLVDICAAADAALAIDNTLKAFLDNLGPHLVKRGWCSKKQGINPEARASALRQFSSRPCLKVLYDTNLRIAHAERQWQRIQKAKDTLPYLLYDHVPNAYCASLGHAAWDGLVLPVDDPWWQSHFPPKAWGCLCRVIQMGERQIERLGAEVGKAPEEKYATYVNPRHGEAQKVTVGVDPAFNFPPGWRPYDEF